MNKKYYLLLLSVIFLACSKSNIDLVSGRLKSYQNSDGTINFEYNAHGYVTSIETTFFASGLLRHYKTTIIYNSLNKAIQVLNNSGDTSNFTYDKKNRLATTPRTIITYNNNDQIVKEQNSSVKTEIHFYYDKGNITLDTVVFITLSETDITTYTYDINKNYITTLRGIETIYPFIALFPGTYTVDNTPNNILTMVVRIGTPGHPAIVNYNYSYVYNSSGLPIKIYCTNDASVPGIYNTDSAILSYY